MGLGGWGGGGRRQGKGIGDKKSCITFYVFFITSIMMLTELLQRKSLRKCVLCELISYVSNV